MAVNLPELAPVERLSPRVIRIMGANPNKYTLQGSNTYLVGTGPTRILIDTGEGRPQWTSSLASVLKSEKCSVSSCLLTHWHGDHVRGAPDVLNLCPEATLHKFPGGPDLDFPDTDGMPLPSTAPIRNGEVFATHGATLRAVHCPGHTVDHCAFTLQEEHDALFSGDNVLGHGTAVFEDLGSYMKSLSLLKTVCGANARIYPGHGAIVEAGRDKLEEYIQHRQQREVEVFAAVKEKGDSSGATPMEIVKVVYKNYPEALHAPAEGGVKLILKKLEGDGTVEVREGRWRPSRGKWGTAL